MPWTAFLLVILFYVLESRDNDPAFMTKTTCKHYL